MGHAWAAGAAACSPAPHEALRPSCPARGVLSAAPPTPPSPRRLPFYRLLRVGAMAWLALPQFQGATFLYETVVSFSTCGWPWCMWHMFAALAWMLGCMDGVAARGRC